MKKLVLMSVLIAAIVIPARAARMKSGKQAFKKTLIRVAAFNAFYLFALLFIWGRL